ncbi:MAG: dephospho-CoA kinase, partial [Paludibacter sp.]
DIETRIERVMTRDGINRNQVLARIQHQTSTDDILKYADIVVDTTQNDVSTLDIQSIITRLQKTDE